MDCFNAVLIQWHSLLEKGCNMLITTFSEHMHSTPITLNVRNVQIPPPGCEHKNNSDYWYYSSCLVGTTLQSSSWDNTENIFLNFSIQASKNSEAIERNILDRCQDVTVYPERPSSGTLKWMNGNPITHSHSLNWLVFKVSQRTRKRRSVTFGIRPL